MPVPRELGVQGPETWYKEIAIQAFVSRAIHFYAIHLCYIFISLREYVAYLHFHFFTRVLSLFFMRVAYY